MALDRADEAAEMLAPLVARRPDDANLRVSYGVVLARVGDLAGSERELKRVIEQHPEHAAAPLKLGQIVGNQGRFEEALGFFDRAATLNPDSPLPHALAGQAALQLQRPDVALQHLEAARRLAPYDTGIVQTWAVATRDTGSLKITIAAAEASDPTDRTALFALMHIYNVAGRTEDAGRLAAEFAREASSESGR
ncbi:MAG: tetratricopeptide repeat protein [Planctomycetes bacterium]|nr:tetratricopeptide repeat protein [Planctomycetota bacterium]